MYCSLNRMHIYTYIRRPQPIAKAGAAPGTTFGVDLGFATSASMRALLRQPSPAHSLALQSPLHALS